MLTIGALAQLFDISTHQIRYYEEVGLFLPTKVDGNGYRKYNDEAIYQLASILELRAVDFSTKEIGLLLDDKKYGNLLQDKILDIDVQIKKLLQIKERLQASLKSTIKKQKVILEDTFLLKKIGEYQIDEDFNVLDFNDSVVQKQVLSQQLYYFFENETYAVYIKSNKGEREIPLGTYIVEKIYSNSALDFAKQYTILSEKSASGIAFVVQSEKLIYNAVDLLEFDVYTKEVFASDKSAK